MRDLCPRVGYRSNFDVLKPLQQVEGEASPAASEVDDLHAILDLGPLDHQVEGGILCLIQSSVILWVDAAGVLLAVAESILVVLGWHLVMLLISGLGLDGDRHPLQFLHEGAVQVLHILHVSAR